MKSSFYNIYYSFDNRYFILNTLHGTITELDRKLYNCVSEGSILELEQMQCDHLSEQGVITAHDDEFDDYLDYFQRTKDKSVLDIQFLVATSCNLACPYCYLTSSVERGKIISQNNLDLFIKWIDRELSNRAFEKCQLSLYGGEPLMAKNKLPYLFERLNYIAGKTKTAFDYSIVTNGTLLDADITRLLIENNTYIQITLDGKPETHNKRRFAKGKNRETFQAIWNNIQNIIDLGGNENLKIRMNVDKDNWNEIESLAQMCKDIGVKNFELSWIFFNSPEMPDYDLHFDTSEYDKRVLEIWKKLQPYGYAADVDSFMKLSTCMLYRKSGYVINDKLEVYKCDEMIYDQNHKIGNINKDGNLVLTNEQVYNKAIERSPLWFNECVKCKLLPVCGTGCPVKALRYNGNFDTFYCETSIENIEQRIRNYIEMYDIIENEL